MESPAVEKSLVYQSCGKRTGEKLLRIAATIDLPKGRYLFRIRDEVDFIYVVSSGFLLLERESDGHGDKCVFLVGPDEMVNEVVLDSASASITCKAISDAKILAFPRSSFRDLMQEDFGLNQFVVSSMARKIRRLYHMVEGSTKVTRLDHQVASRLWKFARDYGVKEERDTLLPFELRVTTLAGFVGSNRESVSRVIGKMTEEKVLSIRGGICRIYDMERLKGYCKN